MIRAMASRIENLDLDPRRTPTLDLPTAARLLGYGRSTGYDAVHDGTWPTPIIRVGHRIRVPTAPLLRLLGLEADASEVGDPRDA